MRAAFWIVSAFLFAAATVGFSVYLGQPVPLVISSVGDSESARDLDFDRLTEHVKAFSSAPSRMTGSDGERAAFDHIVSELREMGVDDIQVLEFEVPVPVTRHASLSVGDATLPVYPLWPNLARTSQTEPDGVAGPFVDGGGGTDDDLAGKLIRGSIVVIDWDCREQWLAAPELGAKAVIFRGDEVADGVRARGKFLTVPAAMPRFYVRDDDCKALDEMLAQQTTATVACQMEWTTATARNLLARIPAADDSATSQSPVVFHAAIDSISVVPDLAPGAEQACGAAALIELSRYLVDQPRARPAYALFTGAHGQAMSGMTRFVRALKGGDAAPDSLMARMGTPGLMVGLDLSSHSDRFGIFCCGHFRGELERLIRPKFSTLALKLAAYARELTPDIDPAVTPTGFVDCVNLTLGRGWWTYFPYQAPFASEIPSLYGIPGVTLSTINDARRHVDTPDDTLENVSTEKLAKQLLAEPGRRAGLSRIAQALTMWGGPFTSGALPDKSSRLSGRVVWLDQERNYTPNEPLVGALVCLKAQRGDKYLLGTRGTPVALTDESGAFDLDGLINSTGNTQFLNCQVEAYGMATESFLAANPRAANEYRMALRSRGNEAAAGVLDRRDGSVIFAVDMARESEFPHKIPLKKADERLNLVTFPCRSVTLYGLTDPREYVDLAGVQILDASTQSPPFQYGHSSTDAAVAGHQENCVTLWSDPSLRVRLTFGFGFQKKRLILINNNEDDPIGAGYELAGLNAIPSMALEGAGDMWRIDDWRLKKLESHGVENPRVIELHEEARSSLDTAHDALDRRDYREYRAAAERAWGLEGKAYSELLSMTNNMIRGVMFYLALLAPFAYCLERLLFSCGTIRNRILAMTGIFGVSFTILAAVHPAFRFTMTPLLVLEAFVILALAGAVCVLVIGKFDEMLKERKRASTGVHEDTTKVAGITTRAIDLGIANIRRRKQRGLLTAMTIIMVMFTLLSFVSIVPELSISTLRHPEGVATYKGQLTRGRAWEALRDPVFDSIRRNFVDRGDVAARAWFFSDATGELSQIDLTSESDEATTTGRFTAISLLCLDSTEPAVTGVDKALVAGRWFRDRDEVAVILPTHVATQLGYDESDIGRTVTVFGDPLRLIGLVDAERLDAIEDLDGEPITPVNFVLQNQMAAESDTPVEEADTLAEYVHYPTDQLIIVPFEYGRRLGATLRSVGVRVADGIDPVEEAKGFARRSSQTLLACDGENVTLFTSVAGSKLSAAGQIVVPVFLGFLMVLGTMMGSVYERKSEIFIYNSVGLSPTHVASLFMAESAVYATVGACLGFLLGQVVSKVIVITGAFETLTLNYSAGTTVFVTLMTMLIVLASTIYPARQAFNAAIPEGRAEEDDEVLGAQTDELSFYLPFVATPTHIGAMQAYMREYLASMEGVTIGQLAIDELSATTETDDDRPSTVLRFRAWLAPFDLGVSHDADLRIRYRADRGVYQYHLSAVRFSGDQQGWRRLNPRFILALRKQLLMWRALSAQEQDRYVATGEQLFGALDAEIDEKEEA